MGSQLPLNGKNKCRPWCTNLSMEIMCIWATALQVVTAVPIVAIPCPAMWNQVFLQNSAINGSSDIWSRTHKEVLSHMRDTTPSMYRIASVSHITMCKYLFMASPTSLRTRIRLSIRKSMNRLSSQKMTCCHWPSGRLMCFWAQWRRTSLALTVNLGTFSLLLPFA